MMDLEWENMKREFLEIEEAVEHLESIFGIDYRKELNNEKQFIKA